MRLKKPTIAVTAVAMLALAACGGSSGGGNGPGETGSSITEGGKAGQGKDPNRQAPAPEIEGATKGGIVHFSASSGLEVMDPSEAYYSNTLAILTGLVTRSLTQYAYDEASGSMILIPDLATDLGTPNEDFTEWKFTIRDGVKYEDGTPVTAEDVAYGIKRSFDRDTFPSGAAYSNDYFLDGDTYKGPYKSPNDDYAGVVVDGMTLTIKMARPFPDMPYWGFFPAMGPIPAGDKSNPATYALHPLATGPYMFDQYTPQKSLTLVRNPEWDPATDPGRTQYPDGYDMRFDVDTAKLENILISDTGDGQTTMTDENLTAATYFTMKEADPDRLVSGPQPLTFYWCPDYRKIKEIEVRQALAWAYPYQSAQEAAGHLVGVNAQFGANLLPPGLPGREEFNPLPGHKLGQTDPAKSKALLAEAGYKPGEYEISYTYQQDDDISVDVKDVIAKALKEGGFKPKPFATTVANSSTDRENLDTPINVRSAGWLSDWPGGGSWIPPLLGTTDLKAEGLGSNYCVFSEPDVDKKIAETGTLPLEAQPKAWSDLDKYIQETYFPFFVTYYGAVTAARGSKIMGHHVDDTGGEPTFKNIWVAQ